MLFDENAIKVMKVVRRKVWVAGNFYRDDFSRQDFDFLAGLAVKAPAL